MPKIATLKDVAGLAGVSTATVARVLHNNGYVAPATRRTVEAALAETGYQLNAVAQGLRKRRTFALGHLLHSISPNPFFAGVALGVEQEAAARGCGVLVFNTQGDPAQERRGVETLVRRRVDAVLFTTVSDERNVELAARAGVPIVQVERVSPVPTHAVTVDNYRGAFDATAHLCRLGHRRIAFVGVDPSANSLSASSRHEVERERLAGYLDALRAHDRPVESDLIALGDNYLALDQHERAIEALLSRPRSRRPTALVAGCDMIAAGALQQLYARRLRVPDDVSVVGFDDTYATLLTPPLTTVAQPMIEIGRAAARLAIEALQKPNGGDEVRRERLATRLVVRASTGPAPEAGD